MSKQSSVPKTYGMPVAVVELFTIGAGVIAKHIGWCRIDIMKRLLRIIMGVIVIILGVIAGLFSVLIWPQPMNWATVILSFTPVAVFAIALVAIGWAIIQGMSRREAIGLLMFLWH